VGHAWKVMAGVQVTDGVVIWTETWGTDNIRLLWPSAPPSMLDRYSGSFLTSTSGAADERAWRSTPMLRTYVEKSAKGGVGSKHCS
jgi:hypothetical protein